MDDDRSIAFMSGYRMKKLDNNVRIVTCINNEFFYFKSKIPRLVMLHGLHFNSDEIKKYRYCLLNKDNLDDVLMYRKLYQLTMSDVETQLEEGFDIWTKQLFAFFKCASKTEREILDEKYKDDKIIIIMFYK